MLKVVKRLLDTGVSLQNIRTAVNHLRERGTADLTQITLMSDGTTVYACTSPDEVVDLVQGGQGVFGIAVGRVVSEVEGTLAELPAERADARGGRARLGRAGGAPVAAHDRLTGSVGAASRTLRGRVPGPPARAPKGQPPRNLSGHRTAQAGHSGKPAPAARDRGPTRLTDGASPVPAPSRSGGRSSQVP